jgi:hypothetical protein
MYMYFQRSNHVQTTLLVTLAAVLITIGGQGEAYAATPIPKAGTACKKAQAGSTRNGLTCTRSGTKYRWVAAQSSDTTTTSPSSSSNSTNSTLTTTTAVATAPSGAFTSEVVATADLLKGWPAKTPYFKGASRVTTESVGGSVNYEFTYPKGTDTLSIWTAWAATCGGTLSPPVTKRFWAFQIDSRSFSPMRGVFVTEFQELETVVVTFY